MHGGGVYTNTMIIKLVRDWGLLQYRLSLMLHLSFATSFVHSLFSICLIVLKVRTDRGSGTAVLCVIFQNEQANSKNIMDEWYFAIFQLAVCVRSICHIATVTKNSWIFISGDRKATNTGCDTAGPNKSCCHSWIFDEKYLSPNTWIWTYEIFTDWLAQQFHTSGQFASAASLIF